MSVVPHNIYTSLYQDTTQDPSFGLSSNPTKIKKMLKYTQNWGTDDAPPALNDLKVTVVVDEKGEFQFQLIIWLKKYTSDPTGVLGLF